MHDLYSFFGKEDGKIYGEAVILGLANQGDSTHLKLYDTLSQRIPIMFGMNWFTHPLLSYPVVMPCIAYGLTDRDQEVRFVRFDSVTSMSIYDTTYKNSSKIKNAITFGLIGAAAGAATWLLNRYFKINGALDIISVELEHYGSPYPNGFLKCTNVQQDGLPQPDDPRGSYNPEDYLQDDWKWSVYFNKTVMGHFRLIGQLARDHTRLLSLNANNRDFEETLTRRNHWCWMGKIAYTF
jgi:hypothetical protein